MTNTWTVTPSPTYTPVYTYTQTFTPTSTPTLTQTSTPSYTPTSVVISLGSGSSGTVNVLSGSAGVTVFQVALDNPSSAAVTLNNLTVLNTGSGNASNVTSVSVVINGTQAGSPGVFTTNTANLNLNNTVLTPGTVTLEILVSYSGTGTGNYQFSLSSLTGTSSNNGGQPASFTGLPVSGYSVQVQQPTGTATPSFTPTATITSTVSATPTVTQAPTALPGHVGIYPNPVTGPTVQVLSPPYMGVANVRVEIFTLAFRKVQDTIFDSIPSGTAVTVNLTGRGGNPLANGIYYVVVTVNEQRSIGKLLILR